ncbi:chloride channel protein, partial [Enterovibrio norvegicus]
MTTPSGDNTDNNPERKPTSGVMRRFLATHKSSLPILFLSVFVGLFAGLLCTFFDITIDWVVNQREHWLDGRSDLAWSTIVVIMLSSSILSAFGFYLVIRMAPEAAGSGIPEIEGALDGVRPVRWWRVIPVKFFGGIGAIGAGLVLGREGPSVQMGASVGRMLTDIF